MAHNCLFFREALGYLVKYLSEEDERWIKEHRIENSKWNIFFLNRNNGWDDTLMNVTETKIMCRDILDAKKNRIKMNPFSKNPHLAQLSAMLDLNINGKKINETEIKAMILEAIKKDHN